MLGAAGGKARAEARVGTMLMDKWRIDALLGIGGMACVYRATHRNNRRGAIKILRPELSNLPDIRARFLREGYVANSVGHPGAVAVLDDDVAEDGSAFIVMELLEGETVRDRAKRHCRRLPAEEVLSIADEALDVLVAAHEKGIVHRDIKPDNLFLDRNTGQLKVLDFGIARLREGADTPGTQAGSLMGTTPFMPPEQARGLWDEVDGRSDLWAMGATMFTLLTGRRVHQAQTSNEALAMAITQRAPSLATVLPDADPRLVALVDRALAYEKEGRFPDAASMQAAVRELRGGARLPAASQPDGPKIDTAIVAATGTPPQWQNTTTGGVQNTAIPIPTRGRSLLLLAGVVGGAAAIVVVVALVLHHRVAGAATAAAPSASLAPVAVQSAPAPTESEVPSSVPPPPPEVASSAPAPPPSAPVPTPAATPALHPWHRHGHGITPVAPPTPPPTAPHNDSLGGRL